MALICKKVHFFKLKVMILKTLFFTCSNTSMKKKDNETVHGSTVELINISKVS